jgi:carbon monoxide dehydrogenase subunit G
VRFEHEFSVPAAPALVWDALLDLQRVAPCMPGAEVLARSGEDAYRVGVRVRLGPISMLYRGQVKIVERDPAARRATLHASAQEARGQGTAEATVQMSLSELSGEDGGAGTNVRLETDLRLSGRAAAMGRGVIGEVAEQLIGEFSSNLRVMLDESPASAPASATPPPESPPADATPPPESSPADATPPPESSPADATPPPAPASADAHARPPSAAPVTPLPAGRLVAGIIAARLRDPRALTAATLALLAVGFATGYRLGRAHGR